MAALNSWPDHFNTSGNLMLASIDCNFFHSVGEIAGSCCDEWFSTEACAFLYYVVKAWVS